LLVLQSTFSKQVSFVFAENAAFGIDFLHANQRLLCAHEFLQIFMTVLKTWQMAKRYGFWGAALQCKLCCHCLENCCEMLQNS
jgi:hypothetical protein